MSEALAGLRLELAAAREEDPISPRAIELAGQIACALAGAFEDDEAREVLDQLSDDLADDRELALATHEKLAGAFEAQHDVRWVCDQLKRQEVLLEDDERWLDTAIRLTICLVDELEEDEAAELVERITEHTAHDRALLADARLRIGRGLVANYDHADAVPHLRVSLDLAPDAGVRADIIVELAAALRSVDPAAEIDALVETALGQLGTDTQSDRDRAAALYLLIAHGDATETHARRAWELTATTTIESLRARAAYRLASALDERGARNEAETLLRQAPQTATDPGLRALLEHVRRQLGTGPDEPPAHELGELPPTDGPRMPAARDILRATFVRPADVMAHLRDGGLVRDSQIREWSYGPVRTEADLDSQLIYGPMRSYFCACGRYRGNTYAGVVCELCRVEVISSTVRSARLGLVTLREPVVHPWYVDGVAEILGLTPDDLRELPGDALARRLQDCYLGYDVEHLDLAQALLAAKLTLDALLLTVLPVMPPEGDVGANRAEARAAYARILGGDEPNGAVAALFRCFA